MPPKREFTRFCMWLLGRIPFRRLYQEISIQSHRAKGGPFENCSVSRFHRYSQGKCNDGSVYILVRFCRLYRWKASNSLFYVLRPAQPLLRARVQFSFSSKLCETTTIPRKHTKLRQYQHNAQNYDNINKTHKTTTISAQCTKLWQYRQNAQTMTIQTKRTKLWQYQQNGWT